MEFKLAFHIFLLVLLIENCLADKPIITHGVTDTFGYENQPASLQCRVQVDGPVTINWYHNNSKISESIGYRMESSKYSNDLIVSELVFLISENTVGSYYCNASNGYGHSVSTPAHVYVAFMDDDFSVEPQSRTASIGETVILHCQPPNASPKPVISWYKNNKELMPTNRIQVIDGSNLRIEQLTWADSGSYVCVAKSPAFEKSSSKAHLRVRQRPFFLVAPESQTIPVNGMVEFACRVSGDPPPTLTWSREPPIPTISTARSVLLADGSLKLSNVQLEDAGDYICQSSNDGGVVEAVAHLTVTSPPGFVETPPGTAVFLEGTRAQLACLAIGYPSPEIRWINQETSEYYLNGIISSSQRIVVTNSGSLIINTVRLSDSGTYECRASSSAGFSRTVIHLFVQPNPHLFPGRIGFASRTPVFASNARSINEVKLVCSTPDLTEFYQYMASGAHTISEIGQFNPLATFKTSWYKEKREISLSVSSNDRFRSDDENSLIINPVHGIDFGNYSCTILGLMNKRIAFWPMQIATIPMNDRFNKPYSVSEPPAPPTNVSIQAVGDTWATVAWEYDPGNRSSSNVQFTVFYLLQFHNSTYVSNRRINNFNSIQIPKDPGYGKYESPADSGTIDDGQYPLDIWERAAESTYERLFRLTGLLPDSGYWIEVRASNQQLWSQGSLVSRIVYTAQSAPSSQLYSSLPLEPGKTTENFQDVSARVHSLVFLGVSARSLSASEMFVSWSVQTNNGAVRLVDGFQVVAKPVFMSRCSARATSFVKDMADPTPYGIKQNSRFNYVDTAAPEVPQAHCSFNSEQLIERFRQASVNGAQATSTNSVPEKFLIVSRLVSRDSPSTGAVMGGLHPFTCYEITVKAFKDDQTYGRIWSRETPAELVLSLDSAPSKAPKLISAEWLSDSSTGPQNTFHSALPFGNYSRYSIKQPEASSGIRLKWTHLDLHLSHGTLIGYSIHLIANDSSYTQSQKVSPDVTTHDLLGLNANVEYTIYLAGITCRGEGVRGPGYRMPRLGSPAHSSPGYDGFASENTVLFPIWAYGAVCGGIVLWLLIGCLFAICLRHRKAQQDSRSYCSCSCCFSTSSGTKPIKNEATTNFRMSTRRGSNGFGSPVVSSEIKSSHTVTTNADTSSENHSTSARLQRKASRNGGLRNSGEDQRLLKGPESSAGDQNTQMLTSSSSSTPTNTTGHQGCFQSQGLPMKASVPYPNGSSGFQQTSSMSGTYNMINSLLGFSPQSQGAQMNRYETQWPDPNLQIGASGRGHAMLEVPPYASSNVLPPEVNHSTWNQSPDIDHRHLSGHQATAGWSNYPQRVPPLQVAATNDGGMPLIPPPPPYPPPPLPSGGSSVAPVCNQEALRHLSDDGSLPSGGSYLSGYYTHDGCHIPHPGASPSPYNLNQLHQSPPFPLSHLQFHPRTSAEVLGSGGGETSGGSSLLSSHHQHHVRSPPPAQRPRQQLPPAAHQQTTPSQRSGGQSMAASLSPVVAGPHGYMTGGTTSSNDSATSMPTKFPPSARDSRLMQAVQMRVKSTSNSSGSHCSSNRVVVPSQNQTGGPLYQTPEPVFTSPPTPQPPQTQQGNRVPGSASYEQRSSLGDNMTYSEVNSTTDFPDGDGRDGDDEAEGEETDFDVGDCRSFSLYGHTTSSPTMANGNFSHPLNPRTAKVPPSDSPKLIA